ncbi:hypothetical protein [Puniceicoccus vermicola]|uniref:Uncharacterized protein n=1 Tax=Puniceicoccus vermicola TaxID=388746 RepID=A0A7X1E4K4_9BACT|nr:hypothetical protein [Puniceicoccus vermicola]MBC2602088.1 hypothetical protein [Puniceicoccus vermicola]
MAQVRKETTGTNVPLNGEIVEYNGYQCVGDGSTKVQNLGTLTPKVPIEVGQNSDKLALTDLSAGQRVLVTDEANRVEEYLGDIADNESITRVQLSGAGTIGFDGFYEKASPANGKDTFYGITTGQEITWTGTHWQVYDFGLFDWAYRSSDDTAYPWQATTWEANTGYGAVPDVEKVSASANDNWAIIGPNTFELTVTNNEASSITVNGVSVGASATVNVGWVRNKFTHSNPNFYESYYRVLHLDIPSSARVYPSDENGIYWPNFGGSGSHIFIPIVIPDRGAAYIGTFGGF